METVAYLRVYKRKKYGSKNCLSVGTQNYIL